MTRTLYLTSRSPFARKVQILLAEKNLDCSFRGVGGVVGRDAWAGGGGGDAAQGVKKAKGETAKPLSPVFAFPLFVFPLPSILP